MNYRYGILAAALAVSLCAVPAMAGVTDIEGGQGVKVNETVNNHYTDVEGTRTTVKNQLQDIVINKSKDTSSTNYRVEGNLHYVEHGAIKTSSGWGTYTADKSYSKTSNDLTSAKNSVVSNMYGYEYNKQDGRPGGKRDNGGGNSWSVGGLKYVRTDGSITTKTTSERKTTTDKTGAWYEKSVDKHLDDSLLTYTGTTYSSDAIFVGDPDDIFSAYAAQGTATVNQVRDNYYTRTHNYERVRTVQDTVTNTTVTSGTKTKVYSINATRVYSPIVLDLDGDGRIEASNGQYLAHNDFSTKVATFDFFGNGFPVMTEWVGANDGLLCRPAADGSVKGTNLFGIANGFSNGYEELASLDKDNDGVLSGAELNGLKVWTDVNGNAIAEASELKSLDELGITAISVSHDNYASTFVRNGQTFKSFDWWPNCREMRKVEFAISK